jgi:hypothetical protein
MENNTEDLTSAFNEATFKMGRLNVLQEICNKSRESPLSRDDHSNAGILNHYNALVSLYQEVSSKLNTTEQEKVKPRLKKLRPIVRKLNRKLPKTTNETEKVKWYQSKEGQELMDNAIDGLFDIEEIIRKFLDEKGFSTLNNENNEGDQYN